MTNDRPVIDDSKQAPIHILAAKYGGIPKSYLDAHPEFDPSTIQLPERK